MTSTLGGCPILAALLPVDSGAHPEDMVFSLSCVATLPAWKSPIMMLSRGRLYQVERSFNIEQL